MSRTTRVLVLLATTAATVAAVTSLRRRRPADVVERTGDVVPGSAERREALVVEASDDSFPASDPPSYWRDRGLTLEHALSR